MKTETKTTEIVPFGFKDLTVRAELDEQGEAWFCANDVCAALGYTRASLAIKDHCKEKGVSKRRTLTTGGPQDLIYLTEGNVFRLVMRSKKPEAEEFESFVMEDVLPQLRKTGRFSMRTDDIVGGDPIIHMRTEQLRDQAKLRELEARLDSMETQPAPAALPAPMSDEWENCRLLINSLVSGEANKGKRVRRRIELWAEAYKRWEEAEGFEPGALNRLADGGRKKDIILHYYGGPATLLAVVTKLVKEVKAAKH